MRKAFLLGAVAASAILAGTAWADVTVTGTVDKDQTITIRETLTKAKAVVVTVTVNITPSKAGEASSHFNQENNFNLVCENCAEKTDLITGSVLGNLGITSVNQSSGNNNNQGTVISFGLDATDPPDPPGGGDPPPPSALRGFAESQVAGSQHITNNTINTVSIIFRDALIAGSINNNIGITAVNQAAGNVNNQANAISLGVSLLPGVALSDAALGQWVVTNTHSEINVSKSAQMTTSVMGNTGITQVNQSAGNLGNQSNVVSIALTSPLN
jgi:hypothetical protein